MDDQPPPDPPNPTDPSPRGQRGRAARGSRDQVVADLDAELRAARRELTARLDALAADLETTRATTAGTTGLVAETLPRVEDLAAGLAELRGRVDQLTATVPADPATPPVCWPALSTADAETAWDELAGWVADVLGPWYQLTRGQLPDCWALHRPAVLELSWLHTCWRDAYQPSARATAAGEWHARWRPAALAGIADTIPTQYCRPAPDRPGDHLVDQLHVGQQQQQRGTGPYGPPPGTTPPPSPVGASSRRDFTDPADQITTPAHWGPYLEQAKATDLDRRRRQKPPRGDRVIPS